MDRPFTLGCKPGKVDCRDEVVNKLILPTTNPQKHALQIGGQTYNAFGTVLGALMSLTGGMQDSVDSAVSSGAAPLLLRLRGASFVDEPKAGGQVWLGAKATCCQDPGIVLDCALEAAATCFKGDHVFEVDPGSSQDTIFEGKIAGGDFRMATPKLKLLLPFGSAGVLALELKSVQLRGRFAGFAIQDGVLAGALSKDEVDVKLIPAMANLLDATAKSDPKVKEQILNLFDLNKDGSVSTKEVAGNPLISTFLAGDVDVDGDGSVDLSLGVGYTAVPAVINE